MARQKLPPPPPAASQSDTSSDDDDDSSSDEEQVVLERAPSDVKTPKPTERDDESESESDSDSESEPQPEAPTKTLDTLQKPSESEDDGSSSSSSEDEDDEEEPKSPAKRPESEPDKKKVKLSSAPDQSPSKKSASAIQRIWSSEDEMAVVRALSDYKATNGNLPPRKDYALFLSGIKGSIKFPVTEGQLYNKIRHMKHSCSKIKKGSHTSSSNSQIHMWSKLFGDSNKASEKGSSKASKKRGSLRIGGTANGSVANGTIGNGVASNGGRVNGGKVSDNAGNGGDVAGSNFYLGQLIKDMISRQQCPGWFPTVEDVIVQIGESKARDLEAKAKMWSIDMMKLRVREEKLKAELLESFADGMADD